MSGARYALGVGFRRHCEVGELRRLVAAALDEARLAADAIGWLASVEQKRGAPQLDALIARFGWSLELWPAERLAAVAGVRQHSAHAAQRLGSPSVAEAAALASLAQHHPAQRPSLRLETRRSPAATVAIAELCCQGC